MWLVYQLWDVSFFNLLWFRLGRAKDSPNSAIKLQLYGANCNFVFFQFIDGLKPANNHFTKWFVHSLLS